VEDEAQQVRERTAIRRVRAKQPRSLRAPVENVSPRRAVEPSSLAEDFFHILGVPRIDCRCFLLSIEGLLRVRVK
jgi:hypothetical protein